MYFTDDNGEGHNVEAYLIHLCLHGITVPWGEVSKDAAAIDTLPPKRVVLKTIMGGHDFLSLIL